MDGDSAASRGPAQASDTAANGGSIECCLSHPQVFSFLGNARIGTQRHNVVFCLHYIDPRWKGEASRYCPSFSKESFKSRVKMKEMAT